MKKIILNTTGQLSRNNPFRKEMVTPNKTVMEQLKQLWQDYLMADVGSLDESLNLNGIATSVASINTSYTHLYIPLMSSIKLDKFKKLIGSDNIIQCDA